MEIAAVGTEHGEVAWYFPGKGLLVVTCPSICGTGLAEARLGLSSNLTFCHA